MGRRTGYCPEDVEEWSPPDFTNVPYQVGAYTLAWIP
jgi:hypothetical protein